MSEVECDRKSLFPRCLLVCIQRKQVVSYRLSNIEWRQGKRWCEVEDWEEWIAAHAEATACAHRICPAEGDRIRVGGGSPGATEDHGANNNLENPLHGFATFISMQDIQAVGTAAILMPKNISAKIRLL
ncbi:hypothetical protein [Acidiphilium sp. JA12-A1]|uniref:hypothetical protein n=1 Tax=Acidiphilium sp. JA12-A1 TaxID=1464546 RepID=UPI00128F225F|nr:hypothetical protein [Acidiphilium sp. JA12-A1]